MVVTAVVGGCARKKPQFQGLVGGKKVEGQQIVDIPLSGLAKTHQRVQDLPIINSP